MKSFSPENTLSLAISSMTAALKGEKLEENDDVKKEIEMMIDPNHRGLRQPYAQLLEQIRRKQPQSKRAKLARKALQLSRELLSPKS